MDGMSKADFRGALTEYIRRNANPRDKFSHQARLYALGRELAAGHEYDDDVLFAAAWLHDLGVFVGHRPEDPAALATWDCLAYAMRRAPEVLHEIGFPPEKIAAVVEAIRTHQPAMTPTIFEGTVLRDADILEQLGAVSVLRTVSKVGRDTRFVLFTDALRVLRNNLEDLPGQLHLESARRLAEPKKAALRAFLAAAEHEALGIPW